ncbi:MAG: M48 family metalloprotease [Nitrosarchaeum sp.]
MISKIMIKTSFKTRMIISISLMIIGTVYVLSPNEFRLFFLIPYVIFLIAYFFVYLRYDVRTLRLITKKKTGTLIHSTDFNPDIEKMFQSFSSKLENKIHVVFSNTVDNFEARSSHKIIYVNPTYAKQADKQEIEASIYHELGHIKEFWSYFFDIITLLNVPMFYWVFFTAISMPRIELLIISGISTLVLTRFMLVMISWRNEYRADRFASKYVSLETMGKMFELIPHKFNVETHPSPSKRWSRISKKTKI